MCVCMTLCMHDVRAHDVRARARVRVSVRPLIEAASKVLWASKNHSLADFDGVAGSRGRGITESVCLCTMY